MVLLKVCLDSRDSKLQKISLDIGWPVAGFYLPHQVDIIRHDNEAIQQDAAVANQEAKALDDNVFVVLWCKQLFPLKAGGGEELRVFRDNLRHAALRLRLFLTFCCW